MSQNFKDSEFNCKCRKCIDELPKVAVRILLQMLHMFLRIYYKSKIRIVVTSGIRCPYWNVHEKGYQRSRHQILYGGDACDIKCYYLADPKDTCAEVLLRKKGNKLYWKKIETGVIFRLLDKLFPNTLGLGFYNSFIHIDTREKKARWQG